MNNRIVFKNFSANMLLEAEPEKENLTYDIQLSKDRHDEHELTKLQRALRFEAGGEKHNFLKESVWITNKIEKYMKEKEYLDTILKSVMCKTHVETYENHVEFLDQHLACQNVLEEEIKLSKLHIQQIHSQLIRLDHKELQLRKTTTTDLQQREILRKAKRNYDIYVNRVYVSKQREGVVNEENRKLRQAIELMLYERAVFNKHWKSLVTELSHNKRFLTDLIERSILAFAKDEELYMRIDVMENRERMANYSQVAEMLQLLRKLDADKIYQDFLEAKGFRRQLMPLDEHEVKRREYVDQTLTNKLNVFWKIMHKILEVYCEEYKKEIDDAKKKQKKGVDNKQPKKEDDNKKKLSSEEQKKLDNEDKIKETARKQLLLWGVINEYCNKEKCYFAHFQYINEIYNQLEFLNTQVNHKQIHITNGRDIQKEHKIASAAEIKQLATFVDTEKKTTQAKQNECTTNETELQKYMNQILEIFKMMKCDTTFIESLLGEKNNVTNFNIKLFLSSLESTLNKMLAYVYYRERKSKVPVNKSTVKTSKRPKTVAPVPDVVVTTQCSECAEREDVNRYDETIVYPSKGNDTKTSVKKRLLANEMEYRMHNLSKCRLPKSRILVNKRYL